MNPDSLVGRFRSSKEMYLQFKRKHYDSIHKIDDQICLIDSKLNAPSVGAPDVHVVHTFHPDTEALKLKRKKLQILRSRLVSQFEDYCKLLGSI